MLPISISVAKSCETPVTHFGKEVLLLLSVVELCGSDMLSIGIEQGLSIYCIDIIINTMLTLNIARIYGNVDILCCHYPINLKLFKLVDL